MSESLENLLRVLFEHKLEMDHPAWEEANKGRLVGIAGADRQRLYDREEREHFSAFCAAHADNSLEDICFLVEAADNELWERASWVRAETGEVVTFREQCAQEGVPWPPETYAQVVAGYNARQPELPPLAKEYDRLMQDAQARSPPTKDKEMER